MPAFAGMTLPARLALLALLLLLFPLVSAGAAPPPERLDSLRRGVNITAWFRFPASVEPAALRAYLSDAAISDLRRAGFTFVRLPVQPELLRGPSSRVALLIEAIRRLHRAGLAVVVAADPAAWRLETSPDDRQALFAFWQGLAPALRPLDPRLTFPELLNEPVFPGAPVQWQQLQVELLHVVRAILPQYTIVLTGNDWGSIAGLEALLPPARSADSSAAYNVMVGAGPPSTTSPHATKEVVDAGPRRHDGPGRRPPVIPGEVGITPVPDDNVIYSIHLYEPVELTSLAAWHPGVDRETLAHLPFPAEPAACATLAARTDAETAGMVRFYCRLYVDPAAIPARIAAAAARGRQAGAPVILGEFGATALLNVEARTAWLRIVRQACEANGIGWALWGYDDVMGFAIARPPAARPRLDANVLRALGLQTPP